VFLDDIFTPGDQFVIVLDIVNGSDDNSYYEGSNPTENSLLKLVSYYYQEDKKNEAVLTDAPFHAELKHADYNKLKFITLDIVAIDENNKTTKINNLKAYTRALGKYYMKSSGDALLDTDYNWYVHKISGRIGVLVTLEGIRDFGCYADFTTF